MSHCDARLTSRVEGTHGEGTTAVGLRARQRDQGSKCPFPLKVGARRCMRGSSDIDTPTPSPLASSTPAVAHGPGSGGAATGAASLLPPSRICTAISELSPPRPIPAAACLLSLAIARRCAATTCYSSGSSPSCPRDCSENATNFKCIAPERPSNDSAAAHVEAHPVHFGVGGQRGNSERHRGVFTSWPCPSCWRRFRSACSA